MDEESLNSMIAEWIFSSYSRMATLNIINENNKLHYLSKIKERHDQILIKNMILSQRKSKEYIANILSFIHDIVSRNWKNKFDKIVAGYYWENSICNDLLFQYQFEVLFHLDPTFLRLKTLELWNEISFYLISYDKKYLIEFLAFKVANSKEFLSKISWIIYYF